MFVPLRKRLFSRYGLPVATSTLKGKHRVIATMPTGTRADQPAVTYAGGAPATSRVPAYWPHGHW